MPRQQWTVITVPRSTMTCTAVRRLWAFFSSRKGGKARLDISDFCSVLVNTVKDILQVAGIDLQETALYHLPGEIIPGDTDKGTFGQAAPPLWEWAARRHRVYDP